MKLDKVSVEWAVNTLARHGDTDILPHPPEFEQLTMDLKTSVDRLADLELSAVPRLTPRRFIVPKDEMSYRAVTQLDPLDTLLLTAAIHQFGNLIEQRRKPVADNQVFSYRFAPSPSGSFYENTAAWHDFWRQGLFLSYKYSHFLLADVADFYNQIYHHTLENQLIASGWPNQLTRYLISVMEGMTAQVSRGVPVGPHFAHLLAEATLIPVDNSLASQGVHFIRYADDIIICSRSDLDARTSHMKLAEGLDKQQRLQLQKSKTRILNAAAFRSLCEGMIADRPINELEQNLLEIIKKYSDGDPYAVVLLGDIDDEDLLEFTPDTVESILTEYLEATPVDYIRLRWFLRRLSQVGHSAAVPFCLTHIDSLTPCLSEVCRYLVSVGASGAEMDWPHLGENLLAQLDHPLIEANEYFQISLLALFGLEADLNHVDKLIARYRNAPPSIRREIILAAWKGGHADWLRELKAEFRNMDPWTRRAYLMAAKLLPTDEHKHFLRFVPSPTLLEELIMA